MKSVLIVDDLAVFREPIAASLRLAGYEALCAADGEQALNITRALHPHVIVLDMQMPKMHAIAFLKLLRADPAIAKTPVIVLTVHSDKKYILAAGSLGVRDYILKSRFRLKDLLARIEKVSETAAAAAVQAAPLSTSAAGPTPAGLENVEIPRLLTRDQLLARINGVVGLKTLSGVVAQVIAQADSARGDMQHLADLIARDAMLSARVLHVANSAAYAAVGTIVTTIPAAIKKIGFGTVRKLAAAVGVFDCMPEPSAGGYDPLRYWQHSFAVAQLCEKLASAKMPDQAGLAYIVGLCHDLGEIVLHSHFAKEYQQVLDVARRTGQPLDRICGQMLGLTEAQISSNALKCLGIPETIREPIDQFHTSKSPGVSHPLARVLWMAENYANGALLASGIHSQVAPLTQAFCQAVVGESHPPQPDAQELRSEVLSLTVSLARLSRSDEAKLTTPMFKSKQSTIWLARERSVSKFDPIETMLKSVANVRTCDRLPAAADFAEIQGLVVVVSTIPSANFPQLEIESLAAASRQAGKNLPFLTVGCEAEGEQNTSLALSELGSFIEKLEESDPVQRAA